MLNIYFLSLVSIQCFSFFFCYNSPKVAHLFDLLLAHEKLQFEKKIPQVLCQMPFISIRNSYVMGR